MYYAIESAASDDDMWMTWKVTSTVNGRRLVSEFMDTVGGISSASGKLVPIPVSAFSFPDYQRYSDLWQDHKVFRADDRDAAWGKRKPMFSDEAGGCDGCKGGWLPYSEQTGWFIYHESDCTES